MEPLDFLTIVRQRWKITFAALLIAAGIAWFTTPATPLSGSPVLSYTATATLVQQPGSGISLPYVTLLATRGPVPKAAAALLGYTGDPAVLASTVSVTPDTQVGTLTVATNDPDGARAAKVANTYAQAIITTLADDAKTQRQTRISELSTSITAIQVQITAFTTKLRSKPGDLLLQAQLTAYQQQLTAATGQLVALYTQAGRDAQLTVLQEATPLPVVTGGFSAPTSHRGRLILGLAVGLVLGLMLALVVDRVDTRLRRRQDVEGAFRLPVVADVPHTSRRERRAATVAVLRAPGGPVAEAYRSLRTALSLLPSRTLTIDTWRSERETVPLRVSQSPQVVLVTSARAAEGKSTTAANLAATVAETGKRVLVIDADFRNPSMHRMFNVPAGAGLAHLLMLESESELGPLTRTTDEPRIRVLTAGHVDQYRSGVPTRIAAVIAEARGYADIVVIDAAPLLGSNDALDFLVYVDSVVVVARLGRVNRMQAGRVSELLGRTRAPVLGVVCIGGRPLLRGSYPRFGSGNSSGPKKRRGRTTGAVTGAGSS